MTDVTILSRDQRALLDAVLNQIIPADLPFPGAGDLGIAVPIEIFLAAHPPARRLFLDGLVGIEVVSRQLADGSFGTLTAVRRDLVLAEVARRAPVFFDQLVSHAYRHYYVNPKVLQSLGLSSAPPQPAGHVLEPFDPALLTQVRDRGPVYRKT